MGTRILVYEEGAYLDGAPAGNPEFKFDDDLPAQDSNSNTWPATPTLRVNPPRKNLRMMVVVTTVPIEIAITTRLQDPDSVECVPISPPTTEGGVVSYTTYLRAGQMKIWARRIDA